MDTAVDRASAGAVAAHFRHAPVHWLLSLDQAPGGGLRVWLSDGRTRMITGHAPWPAPHQRALPDSVGQVLCQHPGDRLSLQLPAALDDWPWEREWTQLGLPGRAITRYITDVGLPDAVAADAPRLVVTRAANAPGHLVAVAQAQSQGRPLVVVDEQWPPAQRSLLETLLRSHWRDPLWFSQALEHSLKQLGLPLDSCRLYGDAKGLLDDAEQAWRPVTALSIDLVDSTPLVNSEKGERYGQTMQAYYRHCREVTEHFHGTLEMPQGDDGLMAYFGFPRAVEGAAKRALMAAWRLSQTLDRLGLKVRIGVASGEVAINARLAYGADVHLAARAREHAQPGQIVVAPATLPRVGPEFVLDIHAQDVPIKGFGISTTLYRLTDVVALQGVVHGGAHRFVGRGQELHTLSRLLDEAQHSGPQWCLVRGEAGLGKSRLLAEFSQVVRQRGLGCLRLSGHPLAERSPFAAIIDLLREHWRIGSDASMPAVRRLVNHTVGESAPEQVEQLVRLLVPTADALEPAPADQRVGPVLLACLQAIIAAAPCCLVVDDAHWIDPSSLQLLDRLRQGAAPQARVVVLGERTGSAPRLHVAGAHELTLRGLPDEAMRELARELGGAQAWVLQRIIDRAEGVPLFLEESLRMLQQRGVEALDELPATLEDLLVSRLDELGLDRAMAQLLSVFGRECRADHVARLLELDDPFVRQARRQGSLDCLLESGFLLPLSGAQPGYRFRHALIRDVAYRSTPTADRERLHGLIATLIEAVSPEIPRERPELIAAHLQAAGRLDEARRAWFAAARGAAARQAYREAVELGRRSLSLAGELSDPLVRARFATRAQQLVAAALLALQGYGSAEVEQAYREAEVLAKGQDDAAVLTRIQLGLEACYVMRGDLRRASQIADQAVAATDWHRDPLLALQSHWAQANVRFHRGHWRHALDGFETCLEHYRGMARPRSAVQDPAVMCLGYSAWILFELGRAGDALDRLDQLLAHARALDHPFSLGVALGFAASIKRLCGDTAAAIAHADEAVDVCERGQFEVWLAHAWMVRGQLAADRGQVDIGAQDMDRGYALWTGGGARISCATYLMTRAEILLRLGDTAGAGALLDEAQRVSRDIRELYYHAELRRLVGLHAWQRGDTATTGGLLARALRLAQRHAKPGLALRCALSLGAWHAAQGRCTQAAALLDLALHQVGRSHARCRDHRWALQAQAAWSQGAAFESRHPVPWEPA
ncbi:AAA family ATPase [Ideonella sp. 4Y11]|uniref:AAA family ATPase n=1 Tax=Ideonella aquatica TaxID=2824119 RepID=A0A940YI80_9BURK|nr:adenylate/guanylate cyclase domain-containing protein [Ideonella aquatica]MBQ0959934.1 AAA family ATPase [Ideonella aquatica]